MLSLVRPKHLNGFVLRQLSQRQFSRAVQIKDRFESAWNENKKLHKIHHHEPDNKLEYGTGYIQRNYKRMKKGYTHPYHSTSNPFLFTNPSEGWKLLSDLVGPEQVSPHYESLSKSRRGLIFLFVYIGAITSIARLGGWNHNEWIRGMIFHHEYLIALYVGYAELRHFTWLPGPKFSIFYDVFSRYEGAQLASQFNDCAEQYSIKFYQKSREQVEYWRIHNEYKYIKKRSLANFLTNERLNLEKHFHDRTVTMLNQIVSYEQMNLKNKMLSLAQDAFNATIERVESDADGSIKEQSFQAALNGIRKGEMDFTGDPVLPILQEELSKRVQDLKNMTPEEESKLLSLTADQKRSLINMDKVAKESYLSTVPHVSSQGLKSHEKFSKFVNHLTNLNKKA